MWKKFFALVMFPRAESSPLCHLFNRTLPIILGIAITFFHFNGAWIQLLNISNAGSFSSSLLKTLRLYSHLVDLNLPAIPNRGKSWDTFVSPLLLNGSNAPLSAYLSEKLCALQFCCDCSAIYHATIAAKLHYDWGAIKKQWHYKRVPLFGIAGRIAHDSNHIYSHKSEYRLVTPYQEASSEYSVRQCYLSTAAVMSI